MNYKELYEKEYEKNIKLLDFIDTLERSTDNWDELCDCGNGNIHQNDCRTMNIRRDWQNLDNSHDS